MLFESWRRERPGFRPLADETYFRNNGYACLTVDSHRNDWFLSAETVPLMAALAGVCRDHGEVVTYGFSMGGFAALLFSRILGASRIVAISPQYSIDRTLCPFETRWAEEAKSIPAGADPAALGDTSLPGYLVYDPQIALDGQQAGKVMARFPHLVPVRLHGGGHPATVALRQAGEIGTLGAGLLAGWSAEQGMALHRHHRRHSGLYLAALADRCAARRPALAETLYRRAIPSLVGDYPHRAFQACARLAHLGDRSHIETMARLIAETPEPPAWWAWKLGQLRAAAVA